MEPQQQPSPLGHNPYDFILGPPKPTKQHPLGRLPIPKILGQSFGLRIAMLVAGAAIIMIIIAVVVSALTGHKLNQTELVDLAAKQTEIIDVAKAGGNSVSASSNQQLAIVVQLTLETDNQKLVQFLGSEGIPSAILDATPEHLSADIEAETNHDLQTAEQSNTVDLVFDQLMQSDLQAYASSIKTDYNSTSNSSLKRLLGTDYTQAELLLKQVPSQSSVEQ